MGCYQLNGYNFIITKENIKPAVKALMESDFAKYIDFTQNNLKPVEVLKSFFEDNGFSFEINENGDIGYLIQKSEVWEEQTLFFNVFAKYVETGSYIEMENEDGEIWRLVFDGEKCYETEQIVLWPEELQSNYSATKYLAENLVKNCPNLAYRISCLVDFENKKEDILAKIEEKPGYENIKFSDQDINKIVERFDKALSMNDGYYESYWLTADYVINEFINEKNLKPSLEEQVKGAENNKSIDLERKGKTEEQVL